MNNIPSWESVDELVDSISDLTREDALLEAEIEFTRASLVKAGVDEGKAVSAVTGTVESNQNLYELKKARAEVKARLKKQTLKMEVVKLKIEVFRTESANARNSP